MLKTRRQYQVRADAFNMACIRLFGVGTSSMLSEKKKSLLVVMCKKRRVPVAWARLKDDRWVNKM